MRTRKVLVFSLPVMAVLAFIGCGRPSSIPLKPEQRAAIGVIAISGDVAKPSTAFYHGPAQSWAAVGGVVGAAAGQAGAKSSGDELAAFMEKEKIHVGQLLTQELEKQIRQANLFKVTKDASAKATLKLEIKIYGLGQSNGLSSTLYPTFGATAQLVKPDGTIVWQKYDYVTPLNGENRPGDTWENYMKNPAKLRKSFENASKLLAKMLASNLANS